MEAGAEEFFGGSYLPRTKSLRQGRPLLDLPPYSRNYQFTRVACKFFSAGHANRWLGIGSGSARIQKLTSLYCPLHLVAQLLLFDILDISYRKESI
jgi:hypothetical protein